MIVGARPNFVKIAPLLHAVEKRSDLRATLVHTGQHYDPNLSQVFFDQLNIKKPDVSLGVSGGTHGSQTAQILEKTEVVFLKLLEEQGGCDRVVVVGDVNSTMAATLAAAKLQIPVSHVEAGLRSNDRSMPEEINRLVTDAVSDQLLVSEPAGVENLSREGHPPERVFLVGNLMIDTLTRLLPQARKLRFPQELGLEDNGYGVVTLHRPSNVDKQETLAEIMEVVTEVSSKIPMVFPVHPRTAAKLNEFGLMRRLEETPGLILLPPAGYLEFLSLTSVAKVIISDSGGLQEESTALGVACLTMRNTTERPCTTEKGSSTLVGNDASMLRHQLSHVLNGSYDVGTCPELWDGNAAERIVEVLTR
ncbi:UDP-N-acetylglucosamine 2-epimerase (non-hydrolyzing) [Pseudomonadales bacterium]|nr:UDP-N-acetylglucosamine 2-epimerase (non-hydrolyzing) [Pseudomonadales bacterium]